MNQKFVVQLTITTECSERMNAKGIRNWVEGIFDDCGVGSVNVSVVAEVKQKLNPILKIGEAETPKSTAAKRPNQCLRPYLPDGCDRDQAPGDVFCLQCREEERDYDRQAQNP